MTLAIYRQSITIMESYKSWLATLKISIVNDTATAKAGYHRTRRPLILGRGGT